jgi:hypothetical protein
MELAHFDAVGGREIGSRDHRGVAASQMMMAEAGGGPESVDHSYTP